MKKHDLAIIGAGPYGLSIAVHLGPLSGLSDLWQPDAHLAHGNAQRHAPEVRRFRFFVVGPAIGVHLSASSVTSRACRMAWNIGTEIVQSTF